MEKALKLVDVLGLDPRKCDSFSKFRQIFSFLCIVSVSLSSHVEFFLNFEGLETYERASESIVPQYQTIFKMLWFVVYKNEIIRMINKFRFFWKLEQFGDSELNTQYFFQIFFYIYVPMLAITCTLFTVVNFVFKTGKPISLCYGESKGLDSPEFEINVSVQAVVMVIIFLGVAGYDMIFFYFIANICMQFKMVKIVFGRRKIKTVTEAVKHHVFLLNYVDQLNEIYSSLLLFQYFSSLFGICFGLFLISKNGVPTDGLLVSKYLPYIIAFTVQSLTFCSIGTLLSDSSVDISDEMFYAIWNDKMYKSKTDILIVINRAQKPAKLTIGKFLDLNLQSFLLIIRSAFSFFAFVNNVLNRIN